MYEYDKTYLGLSYFNINQFEFINVFFFFGNRCSFISIHKMFIVAVQVHFHRQKNIYFKSNYSQYLICWFFFTHE